MRILLLIAVAGLAACSSQPRSATHDEPAASMPAKAAEPTGAAAVARNDSQRFEPPPGFRKREQDGQIVYCRKMVVLGSRFPKRLCMTQAELEEHERGNQAMRDSMSQQNGICGSSVGCGDN